MSTTWEFDSGNINAAEPSAPPSGQPATLENKYVQFVVPSFSLLTEGPSPNAAMPNTVPATIPPYGTSFLRMGSFPVPNATDPTSFATSFALANQLVAAELQADQTWDSGNVSDDQAMLTRGGVWDHSDGNRVVTTLGDKIEVVNGNYAIQVNGGDTVPATSSMSAPIVSTLIGAPGSGNQIGGSSAPSATQPSTGQMPTTKQLKQGDVFTGTWANRIMTYTGSQGNTVPLVYSATYAGTISSVTVADTVLSTTAAGAITSVTTASAIVSTTATADVTNELVALTQQSASQIGVDATLYIAGASVELDIIAAQADLQLIGVQASAAFVKFSSTDSLVVGGAITSNQTAAVITSTTEALGAMTSTTTAAGLITNILFTPLAIVSATNAGTTINNTTIALGIITNTNTAPNTINLMTGISTDIHAGTHIDNHPQAHIDVHVGAHVTIDEGKLEFDTADEIQQILGQHMKLTGGHTLIAEGNQMHLGATIQMM